MPVYYFDDADVYLNMVNVYLEFHKFYFDDGKVYLDDGKIYFDGSKVYLNGSKVYFDGGKVYLDDGKIYLNDGIVYLNNANFYLDDGKVYLNTGDVWVNNTQIACRLTSGRVNTPEIAFADGNLGVNDGFVIVASLEAGMHLPPLRLGRTKLGLENQDGFSHGRSFRNFFFVFGSLFLRNADSSPASPLLFLEAKPKPCTGEAKMLRPRNTMPSCRCSMRTWQLFIGQRGAQQPVS